MKVHRLLRFAAVASAALAAGSIAVAQEAEFKSAAARESQAAYTAAIAEADAAHRAAVEAAAKEYAAALQAAQDAATKAADLDEAIAIRAERERVAESVESPGKPASIDSGVTIWSAVWGERISPVEVRRRLKKTPRGWSIPIGGIERHKMHKGNQPGLMVFYSIDGKRQSFFIESPADVLARP